MILLNSPANPTGAVASAADVRGACRAGRQAQHRARQRRDLSRILLRRAVREPTQWNDQTIVIDGFSKTYGVTGWRLGFVHGPSAIIDKLTMLQQYTFVCAPHPLQWAALAALDVDMSQHVAEYRRSRDLVVAGLDGGRLRASPSPGGAFYVFPKVPGGRHGRRIRRARDRQRTADHSRQCIFSGRDTHFRISYAASEATIERGLRVLERLRAG